ncbi:MAG: exonuclease VII large subunit [Bacteroidales bacterium]|nr:exonuclease VII large subunit [Bacteroidales bacterium]
MEELTTSSTSLTAPQFYKPSEILNIFTDFLARQSTSSKLVYMRGIYFKKKHDPSWKKAYDILRDEDEQKEITIVIPLSLRENIKDGSLVQLGGNISRVLKDNGYIQLQLHVSRIEVVQDQVISEEDIKRTELRNKKSLAGFKNVDTLLEEILYRGGRPKIALVFASTSITMSDFNAGKEAASAHIDFDEFRVPFSKADEVSGLLETLDGTEAYDAISLVRGGGGGIEALDDLTVLERVVSLDTPLICAVGHVEEKIFIKNLADKVASTPNGLGVYFSNMVESVIQKRNSSRAALVEEVKKQYIQQIETAEKQNRMLQEQIAKMAKASEQAQANFKTQSDSMTKQMSSLQENLMGLKKTNEDQAKQFGENIAAMQKTNKELQDSLTSATRELTKVGVELVASKTRVDELEEMLSKSRGRFTFATVLLIIAVVIAVIAFI